MERHQASETVIMSAATGQGCSSQHSSARSASVGSAKLDSESETSSGERWDLSQRDTQNGRLPTETPVCLLVRSRSATTSPCMSDAKLPVEGKGLFVVQSPGRGAQLLRGQRGAARPNACRLIAVKHIAAPKGPNQNSRIQRRGAAPTNTQPTSACH